MQDNRCHFTTYIFYGILMLVYHLQVMPPWVPPLLCDVKQLPLHEAVGGWRVNGSK